jgi:transcriptional regulator with XRE-family HTH domain
VPEIEVVMKESPAAAGHRREQLSDFLRTRRGRLTPTDVGMAAGGRRRTPGLRREEVAALAGIGVSWYTWLEQGRDITVSTAVLDAISTALRMTEPERAHLYLLSGVNPPPLSGRRDVSVTPELLNLLDAWLPRPAMLQDRYWNLLAINDATRTVFGYNATDHNCLITFFTNTRYRDMYVHWTSVAPGVVAAFRADAGPIARRSGIQPSGRRSQRHQPRLRRTMGAPRRRAPFAGSEGGASPRGRRSGVRQDNSGRD